jgi:predicted AAA+ superfamily ATPase
MANIETIKQNLIEQNAHWFGELLTFVERDKLAQLIDYLPLKQIITITGIRRCGKSTLAKQAVYYLLKTGVDSKNILFVNLEQPCFLEYHQDGHYLKTIVDIYLQLHNPQGKVIIIFDEVQYFSNWQVYVKSQYENADIKFIITGSNSSMLSNDLNTILSGRSLNIHLDTFSFSEFLRYKKIAHSNEIERISNKILIATAKDEYLFWGGFYEVFNIDDVLIKADLLISYARNIIYQDIVPRYSIRNSEIVERLFFYLLNHSCGVLNYTALSKTFGVSDKTIKEYINYFEDVFLFKRIDKFHNKSKERIKSKKKLFVLDNGLLQIAPKKSKNLGNALENWAFTHLNTQSRSVHYIQETKEIDFLADDILYQVCYDLEDEKTRKREVSAFKNFDNFKKKLITYAENGKISDIEILSVENFLL